MAEFILLQTHIEYIPNTLNLEESTANIVIYGNLMDTTPAKIQISDFIPYFYVQPSAPVDSKALESILKHSFTRGKCLGVQTVSKQSIYGYSSSTSSFLKLLFNTPQCFRHAKEFLENGILFDGIRIRFKTFESNFPFVLRFMNDMDITGMSYIRVESSNEITAPGETTREFVSSISFLKPEPLVGEYLRLLPLKILSFDIECCGAATSFPDASKDPVIQIGNTIQRFGEETQTRVIFCLKQTAPIPGSEVRWFEEEHELLSAWREFFLKENPDVITGYNIKGFDFPYILDRAEILNLKGFGLLGRSRRVSRVINRQQSSSAFGSFDARDISIDGRIIFDVLHIVRREYKLRSYSLNAVSYHFLKEQKEDVPYSSMSALQNGDPESRRRIASYCLRDTHLPLRLLDKLNILVNYTELSRVTCVPIDFFSTRGAAIKVLAQIYKEAGKYGYLVPDMENQVGESSFEGAFVMEPLKGFYSSPVAVLDFCSLYPSIIISKNLCYTTLLTRAQHAELGGIETPTGNYFCTAEQKEGLLPRILRNLLSTRKETRRKLRDITDPWIRRALDARQLALKICANSIYGFTGAPAGQLPCIEISQSTTGFGRQMIAKTKELIENNFNYESGYNFDAQIIYGDTDSVMINFIRKDSHDAKTNDTKGASAASSTSVLEEIFEVSEKIAKYVTDNFEKPIALAFEKVYYPYLLMNKKRYAGLIYSGVNKRDRIDMKGIETVRRDNCELVKNVVQTCLDKILLENDIEGAIRHVKDVVRNLYLEQIDMSQLVISKTYTKTDYATKQTHTALVEKLRERGQTVGVGDRIPYVIVKGDKKMLTHEKSEDPLYVIENGLPIDKEYYIEQQLSKPIQRIFESIIDNVSSLFHGEHTKQMEQSSVAKGPLNLFVKKRAECLGCRKPGAILCVNCREEYPKHYITALKQFNEKTKRFNECWVECQRCQGSIVDEVLCVNRICPIWYMRMKIKKEIEPLGEKLVKLQELTW